jgi:hypothetical protein
MVSNDSSENVKQSLTTIQIANVKLQNELLILKSEYEAVMNKNLKYHEAMNSPAKKTIERMIDSCGLRMVKQEEAIYFATFEEWAIDLEYRDLLQRVIIIFEEDILTYSEKELQLKQLIYSSTTKIKKQYENICDYFKKMLIDNDLCLKKKDKEMYVEIANIFHTDWETVKQQIYKNSGKFPDLQTLINERTKKLGHSKPISSKSKQKSK